MKALVLNESAMVGLLVDVVFWGVNRQRANLCNRIIELALFSRLPFLCRLCATDVAPLKMIGTS